ncbi:hypothetical protein BOTBODRAFT_53117 [Botryobasidium botryosum FD-172 SS1]|uniref:DNA-directed RNA polymerase subunit n=1 Tax=Botryobasidium botryosum (strain FD-172 SS1) TaxID=930990 RepID=A0A067MS28_BOTB1|nr:hypothetical protein BOTBODRAFT_53117 [Botryobasidium botryosum FD-172 SS1]
MAHKIGMGSLLFCPDCGTLLSLPGDEETIKCEQCGHLEPVSSYENFEVTTRSHPDAFPSALRQKRTTQTKAHASVDIGTKSQEACPKCGHPESFYFEKQTRGADEGSTIFYTCANSKCKHGWKVNN